MQTLERFSCRPRIRACTQKLASDFYIAWQSEVAACKAAFEAVRHEPDPPTSSLPQGMTRVQNVVALKDRLQSLLQQHKKVYFLLNSSQWLPQDNDCKALALV